MNLLNSLFKFKLKGLPLGNVKMTPLDNVDQLSVVYKGYVYPIDMVKLFEFFKAKGIVSKKSNIPETKWLIELDERS